MRKSLNDIITVFDPDGTSTTLWGDGVYGVAWGNDILTAINYGVDSSATLYGDSIVLTDNARGGNDVLTAIDSGDFSNAYLIGDATWIGGSAREGRE